VWLGTRSPESRSIMADNSAIYTYDDQQYASCVLDLLPLTRHSTFKQPSGPTLVIEGFEDIQPD